MRRLVWLPAVVAVGLLAVAAVARAEGEKVPLDKLPKAVLDAVKARYPGAEMTAASKEVEGGKTSYEVYMKYKGKGLDVTFSPAGDVEVVEKEIDAKDLPKNIRAAIDQKHPKASFSKVEEISKAKDGKMVVDIYEILLTTADKKTVEMTIAPDGKVTGDTEKGGAKKDGK
jgi:hypothetical protein